MKRLDWWLGVRIVALVVVALAMLPRYQVLKPEPQKLAPFVFVRIDRWFGTLGSANFAVPWVHVMTPPPVEGTRAALTDEWKTGLNTRSNGRKHAVGSVPLFRTRGARVGTTSRSGCAGQAASIA
jgi:hypothetical protein